MVHRAINRSKSGVFITIGYSSAARRRDTNRPHLYVLEQRMVRVRECRNRDICAGVQLGRSDSMYHSLIFSTLLLNVKPLPRYARHGPHRVDELAISPQMPLRARQGFAWITARYLAAQPLSRLPGRSSCPTNSLRIEYHLHGRIIN